MNPENNYIRLSLRYTKDFLSLLKNDIKKPEAEMACTHFFVGFLHYRQGKITGVSRQGLIWLADWGAIPRNQSNKLKQVRAHEPLTTAKDRTEIKRVTRRLTYPTNKLSLTLNGVRGLTLV